MNLGEEVLETVPVFLQDGIDDGLANGIVLHRQEINLRKIPFNPTGALKLQFLKLLSDLHDLVATPVASTVPDILFQGHGLGPIDAGATAEVRASPSLGCGTEAVGHLHNSVDFALGLLASIIKFECQAILVLLSSLLRGLQRIQVIDDFEERHMVLVLGVGPSDAQDEFLNISCSKLAVRVARCQMQLQSINSRCAVDNGGIPVGNGTLVNIAAFFVLRLRVVIVIAA